MGVIKIPLKISIHACHCIRDIITQDKRTLPKFFLWSLTFDKFAKFVFSECLLGSEAPNFKVCVDVVSFTYTNRLFIDRRVKWLYLYMGSKDDIG